MRGKGAFLIAGYNTMSREEKGRYDEKALCRFAGRLLVAVTFCLCLLLAGVHFEIIWLLYCGGILIPIFILSAMIYANTGNRFRNSDSLVTTESGPRPKATKLIVAAIAISTLVIFVGVGVVLYYGAQEPTVSFLEGSIQIKAMYGLSVEIADITDISLLDKSMSDIGVGKRINGYGGIGDSLKGNFQSDILGDTLLFVASKSAPTICIARCDQKDIYLSFRDSEKTEALYRALTEALS